MCMFRSMTAYGRTHVTTDFGLFLIEIHSVNRRHLDITMNLPREFLFFEIDLRKCIAKEVSRGSVTIRITKEHHDTSAEAMMPDLQMMKALKGACRRYGEELGYDPNQSISFYELLNYGCSLKSPISLSANKQLQQQLLDGFKGALGEFLSMREREGNLMLADICLRLDAIEKQLNVIAGRTKFAPDKLYQKLKRRLEELELMKYESEERLARELVMFTEKVDCTEEMTRLHSHLKQFRSLLSSDKKHGGKELDFLIQEMNREANTIAAKSQDLEITQAVLGVKMEQEKIREQVQNIE